MKELVIISGKGGTGKTSITASFAVLAHHAAEDLNRRSQSKQRELSPASRALRPSVKSTGAVLADCDVDAADLHLVLAPDIQRLETFTSGRAAEIRADDCTGCGLCEEVCRFNAIRQTGATFHADPLACEGCGVCVEFCPTKAIDFPEQECGEWYSSTTRAGEMVHARMHAGAENSGKLVSLVRQEARKIAKKNNSDFLLVDGPPGIGCPVIASITGADAVLIVSEPTLSGEHDLGRVLQLARHFKIPAFVCINKWDINPEMTERIEAEASAQGATPVGRIPYDPAVTAAQINAQTLVEESDGPAAQGVKKTWEALCSMI